jgi:hypothetical protein
VLREELQNGGWVHYFTEHDGTHWAEVPGDKHPRQQPKRCSRPGVICGVDLIDSDEQTATIRLDARAGSANSMVNLNELLDPNALRRLADALEGKSESTFGTAGTSVGAKALATDFESVLNSRIEAKLRENSGMSYADAAVMVSAEDPDLRNQSARSSNDFNRSLPMISGAAEIPASMSRMLVSFARSMLCLRRSR